MVTKNNLIYFRQPTAYCTTITKHWPMLIMLQVHWWWIHTLMTNPTKSLRISGILVINQVFLITTRRTRRVWPVSRGCLLLHGTQCYIYFCRGQNLQIFLLCAWYLFILWTYVFEHYSLSTHFILNNAITTSNYI